MLHSLLLNWFIALAALVNPAGEAKSAITMTPATIDTTFLVSISNRDLDLGMQTVITNNTTSPLQLKWTRKTGAALPPTWETYICLDFTGCYFPEVNTNFDLANNINEPLVVEPGKKINLALHVLPNGSAGSGDFELSVSLTSKPDSVIAKTLFKARVKDFSTSTKNISKTPTVKAYPNPTYEYFELSAIEGVSYLVLYNTLGKQVRQFKASPGKRYDVSDLATGYYLVALKSGEHKTLRTVRIAKQALRP